MPTFNITFTQQQLVNLREIMTIALKQVDLAGAHVITRLDCHIGQQIDAQSKLAAEPTLVPSDEKAS